MVHAALILGPIGFFCLLLLILRQLLSAAKRADEAMYEDLREQAQRRVPPRHERRTHATFRDGLDMPERRVSR